ncbi:hypothetical protein ACU61A_29805 [Pseudonocardia sichuanensis]
MFVELLNAVQRRFNRWVETRDVEDLLDPAGLRDVAALLPLAPTEPPRRRFGFLRLTPEREATVAALQAAGMLRYARGLHLPTGPARDEELTAATDLLNAALPALSELPDDVQELTRLANSAPPTVAPPTEPASSLLLTGAPLGQLGDAIATTRRFVAAHPEDASSRMVLAEIEELRFRRTGDVADLDAAMATARTAVAATPDGAPRLPHRLTALSLMHQTRFAAGGDSTDLDTAIDLLRHARDASGPDQEDWSMHLSNLGRALLVRVQVTGDAADLPAAVDALQAAVAVLDPGELPSARGTRMGALQNALVLRYRQGGDPADLDTAFRLAREAAEATPPGDHNTTDRTLDLTHAHLLRHERSPDPADAAAAARLAEEVLRTTADGDPDRERALAIRDAALGNRTAR